MAKRQHYTIVKSGVWNRKRSGSIQRILPNGEFVTVVSRVTHEKALAKARAVLKDSTTGRFIEGQNPQARQKRAQ